MQTNEIPKTNNDRTIQRGSLRAVRHGITGHILVMPAEVLAAYQRFNQEFFDELKPQGIIEDQLVQSLADTSWRLNRIPAFESNLLALGFSAHIQAFANLSMYGQRLSDQFERTLRQLRRLQSKRRHPPENKALSNPGFVF
jgi:hypothetical protein